jgi:organic radical activating enzyme
LIHGFVHEIFSGIQGEGLFVGERQIFVRLAGCNLECDYCDTAYSRETPEYCRAELTAGKREFRMIQNPVSLEDMADVLSALHSPSNLHHSVSITGGEPLVQAEFARGIARHAKQIGLKVFLETNGTLLDALREILEFTDIISMDVKLGASRDLFALHKSFLEACVNHETYVKMVVTADSKTEDLDRGIDVIASVDPGIPLILQPVTPVSGVKSPTPERMLEWQARCKARLRSVRVIPQCHKLIGQL